MAMNEPSKNDNLIDYALRYAEIGWHVFPLHWITGGKCSCGNDDCGKNSGKHPFSKLAPQGQKNATTDKSVIKRWWSDYPLCNIGVFLFPSGLAAVDVDPRNGGDLTLEGIEAKHGTLPHSVMQFTGGGGLHYLYKVGGKTVFPGTLGKGIDLKRNGYIVVEPSSHISGGAYAWEGSSSPLDGSVPDDFPEWLLPSEKIDADDGDECSIQTISDLRAALNYLIPSADDYQFWVQTGMMLSTVKPSDAGLGLWIDWSKNSDKYTRQKCIEKWKTFKPSDLTYKSVFYHASQKGWNNPGYAIDEEVPGDDEGWRQELISRPGKKVKVLSRLKNVVLFLTHLNEYKGRFKFNAFSHLDEIDGRPMVDADIIEITCMLERHIDEKISPAMVGQAVSLVSSKLSYHPLQDYLNSLAWDGVSRVASMFIDYFGSDDTDYCRDVARSFLVSAVARALKPGSKVDLTVILQGNEGYKKSTFLELMAFVKWHCELSSDIENRQTYSNITGKWFVEFGELSVLRRKDSEDLKSFLTRNSDTYTKPHEKKSVTIPRSNIFCSCTNKDSFFKNDTGNRRFLPVMCKKPLDVQKILVNRDQLWAEAVCLYKQGYEYWNVRESELEQDLRRVDDEWDDLFNEWFERNETMFDAYPWKLKPFTFITSQDGLALDANKMTEIIVDRVRKIFKRNGFDTTTKRNDKGKTVRCWIKK